MGVWIEITESTRDIKSLASLPSWECGLKYCHFFVEDHRFYVTPFVGVWIEIGFGLLVGHVCVPSLPSWECGLKYLYWTPLP